MEAAAAMDQRPTKVQAMLEACFTGNLQQIQGLIAEDLIYAFLQDETTGRSPLMAAAASGNGALCQQLLEAGAPWNALDREGKCAGDYATDNQHWGVVNLLVDWGVRAELILGRVQRTQQRGNETVATIPTQSSDEERIEYQPSTKPDYLRQRLQYTEDGRALLDGDNDAVMMEWERPLMKAHAQILMEGIGRRVLNVGFGMGIIDTALQELQPTAHFIIEAHPDVYQRMLADGWDKKPNVILCFGRWQDVVPKMIERQVEVDAIFFDTVSFVGT